MRAVTFNWMYSKSHHSGTISATLHISEMIEKSNNLFIVIWKIELVSVLFVVFNLSRASII